MKNSYCPCDKKCCKNPNISDYPHECRENIEEDDMCEDCLAIYCLNCHALCYCNV